LIRERRLRLAVGLIVPLAKRVEFATPGKLLDNEPSVLPSWLKT